MKCNKCGKSDSAVVDSREVEDGVSIRRRRECLKCKSRFTTYEKLEQPHLMVIKKDGSRELFDREKVSRGIHKSFSKRPVTAEKVGKLISEVERDIYEMSNGEISSQDVGELIIRKMEKLDRVAYIRFVAV